MEAIQWESGVISASLPTSSYALSTSLPGPMALQQIFEDCGIEFAHCVVHSWGAHVILQMGHDLTDHVGCLVLLDTPLVSRPQKENYDTNALLARVRRDPNLSVDEVKAVESRILPGQPLRVDELDLDLPTSAEVDMQRMALVQHPMCIIRPEGEPWIDEETLQVHRETFNVKQEVVIPNCASHESLFTPENSATVAAAIKSFLLQYDTQHTVETRIEKYRLLEVEKTKATRSKPTEENPAKGTLEQPAAEEKGLRARPGKKTTKPHKRGQRAAGSARRKHPADAAPAPDQTAKAAVPTA